MSKNKLIITAAILAIAGLALAAVFLFKPQDKTSPLPFAGQDSGGKEAAEKLEGELVYKDEAGFSFKYPKGLTASDITPNDNSYYSMVSLKKGEQELVVSMKDTSYKDVEGWLAKDESAPQGAVLSGAVSLAGIPAKQYSTSKELLTVAVDRGVLYLVRGPKDGGYWDSVHDIAVSTLALSKTEPATSASSGDSAIYEDEEVVE